MKGKSSPKIQRRVAGLPIRAALEPRPDSGANPASDIFRAVKENEENYGQDKITESHGDNIEKINQSTNIQSQNHLAQSITENQSTAQINSENTSEIQQTDNLQNEAKLVSSTSPTRFGGGQMRVVSLQPPKQRKIQKKPRKLLKVITAAREVEKIPQLFERTKAEELYDLLYQLTLGADEPCSSVRVRRSDLMANTNINTRLTLDLNLKRLEENGLIKIESRPGEQEGNIYTVFPLPNAEKS